MVESMAAITELICRYAVVEALYSMSGSKAAEELERALVEVYAAVIIYLSKSKCYFEQCSMSKFVSP
jgi:hypothetical protein